MSCSADFHAYARSRDMIIGGSAILVDSRNDEMFASGNAEFRSIGWIGIWRAGLKHLVLD